MVGFIADNKSHLPLLIIGKKKPTFFSRGGLRAQKTRPAMSCRYVPFGFISNERGNTKESDGHYSQLVLGSKRKLSSFLSREKAYKAYGEN